jgi:hypothetical protein
MVTMERKPIDITDDISYYSKDGRLTEEPDGKHYRWKEMIECYKALGRPLTDTEADEFIIK